MKPLSVPLGERSYDIDFVAGPLADAAVHRDYWRDSLERWGATSDVVVVTNDTVAPLYGDRFVDSIRSLGRRVVAISLQDGEQFKDAKALATIHDAMLAERVDRSAIVVAVGGGVVGDVAGFAAATYQRGVRFVQLPTTLLAQVDSSVGGKTGINHRLGKNMIGAFHQPSAVVIDIATLNTLAPRQLRAGLAEVVKYGAILDVGFFDWIEGAMPKLIARDGAALGHAIRRSCELKADIVGEDERESGRRALLNFGHTFGHAIEGATGYGTWLHGEAVSAGMVMAARLSSALGWIAADTVARLVAVLSAAGLPVVPPRLDRAEWRRWMAGDKKADAGRLRFVLMTALGASRMSTVDDAVLDAVLDAAAVDRPIDAAPAGRLHEGSAAHE